MAISSDTLKRLAALKLPGEAFQEVLLILADMQGADDARRERQRHRKAKSRDKSVTVTGQERDEVSPAPLKKESKIPEAKASGDAGPTQAALERELFSRGRQICGKASGGLISSLLKSKQYDVALARSVIELAATKHDPREFVAAATRTEANGRNGRDPAHDVMAGARRNLERIRAAEAGLFGDVRDGAGDPTVRLLPSGRGERS